MQNPEIFDQVHEAAKQMQKALEDMGLKNVTIMYGYTQEDEKKGQHIFAGFARGGAIQSLGIIEWIKNSILKDA